MWFVLVGNTVSGFGSWLLVVALPVRIYAQTGSARATGLALAVEWLPALVVGPWAGGVVDRVDRRTAMVLADLCAAGGVAVMLADSLPAWYLGLLVENVAIAFHRPAVRAAVPALAGARLTTFSSRQAVLDAGLRLAVPPLGTVLLVGFGARFVVVADVVSYLLSAALLSFVDVRRPVPAPRGAGIRFLRYEPELRSLLVTGAAFLAGNAGLTALFLPFVVHRLHRPAGTIGVLIAALGAGYLLGGAASGQLLRRYPVRRILCLGCAATGTAFLVLFNAPDLGVAIAAIGCAGVPGAIALVAIRYRMQSITPDPVLGRVAATFAAADALATVAGGLLGPLIAGLAGLPVALDLLSAAMAGTALLALRSPETDNSV